MIENLDMRHGGSPTLPEAYRSVRVPEGVHWLRRFLAVAGPGLMVSVGYMDPGNWATDLEGGARYGYSLIWVIFVSNLMAILLQTLSARLGLVTGRDLAQACRAYYKKPAAIALWLLCEIAIVACDLAEVVGSAVALKLLFHLPLLWGVLITGLDVIALLGLMHLGFRKLEAAVLTLVGIVTVCFLLNVMLAHADWGAAAHGLVVPSLPDRHALVIAVGILGATVMPHNLYLHSSVVQTREHAESPEGLREAIRLNTWDTVISLGVAFFVNAAILVLAAAVFHRAGKQVTQLEEAHSLLTPMLGPLAATAFAVALLASGQSSTITGTLAGQIVMEGFLRVHIAPWLRRMVTRGLAIIPAMLVIAGSGGRNTIGLLVISQVVLSLQLSFAVFPLLMFTADPRRMGEHASPPWLKWSGYAVGVAIAALNLYLLWEQIGPGWLALLASVAGAFAAWVMFGYRERTEPAHASSGG